MLSGEAEMDSCRALREALVSASRRFNSEVTRDWMCSSRSLARVESVSGEAWRASTSCWEKRTGVSLEEEVSCAIRLCRGGD